MNRRLLRELSGTGQYLGRFQYDLKTSDGTILPDGGYGVVVAGNGWKKTMKFVVSRWYHK
jgi:hypothetical protein